VSALARRQSSARLPRGAHPVYGDALRAESFADEVRPGAVYVHLIGVPHPSPAKAAEFFSVDLPALKASITAARQAGVSRFVYVSVAHPAPLMRAYVESRRLAERALLESGLSATILRPWYVLGEGHRWPLALKPLYALAALVPAWRAGAARLGLVSHEQMLGALAAAVERPGEGLRIVEVPEIRLGADRAAASGAQRSTAG
jgi:uncharacterized protein YbjT (DUF2867 family)